MRGVEMTNVVAKRAIPPVPRTHSGTSALDLLRAHGYVIFDRVLSSAAAARLSNDLEPWFAATPRCRGDFYGYNTTRFGALLLKSPAVRELVLHELVRPLIDRVLGPHCDWWQLNLTQAVRIHPGERQQVPHRDEEMWPGAKNGAEYVINVMWSLSEFTAANGATMLWPRSSYDSLSRSVDPADAVAAEMPVGSALVYLGSVTHCGGANRTTQPRTGLILSYSLGWLKQYENAFLTYPPEIARKFPKEIRDVLGYRIHRPNLGNFEGQDPAVLFESASHTLAAIDALPEAAQLELQAYYEGIRGAQ